MICSVGGQIYEIKKTDILKYKDSYLAHLLKSHKDNQITFIDRDSFLFEHILNYMRGNLSYLYIHNSNTLRILLCDAQFYNLHQMVSDLEVSIQHGESSQWHQFEKVDMRLKKSYFTLNSLSSLFGSRQSQIIRFSLRGQIFETRKDTLYAFKNSLLCQLCQDSSVEEIFIDRDSRNFRHILNFYRGMESKK